MLLYSDNTKSRSAVSQRVTSAGDVMSEGDVTDDATMTCIVFADDVTSDAQTDERVTSLESKHQMSLQSMKELLLSSVSVFLRLQLQHRLYVTVFRLSCSFISFHDKPGKARISYHVTDGTEQSTAAIAALPSLICFLRITVC